MQTEEVPLTDAGWASASCAVVDRRRSEGHIIYNDNGNGNDNGSSGDGNGSGDGSYDIYDRFKKLFCDNY